MARRPANAQVRSAKRVPSARTALTSQAIAAARCTASELFDSRILTLLNCLTGDGSPWNPVSWKMNHLPPCVSFARGPETGFEAISLELTTILIAAWEAASMARRRTSRRYKAKTILRLPDLEQSGVAVLQSLAADSSQGSYGHAIDEFIGWYCSEPQGGP